jgi:hypothetical protein
MADFQITPRAAFVESNELNFRSLYLFHTPLGSNQNQSGIIDSNVTTGLGATIVNNWPICDGPSPGATVVARAQGLHIYAGNWQNTFSITFEVERYVHICIHTWLYLCEEIYLHVDYLNYR